MRTCMPAMMLCLSLVGAALAQAPVEIADGRQHTPWVDLSSWMTHPLLHQASQSARAYWMQKDPEYEEEIQVLSVADGAFTQDGTEQQAVLFEMSRWPRCCPKMGLAIIEGDHLVRNVAFEDNAHALRAVADLDGDGRDELFYIGSFGMGGEESGTLTLLGFEADSLRARGHTALYYNACAAGMAGATAAHIQARPGPAFTVERFTLPSCDTDTWEAVSTPEPFELDPPYGGRYVDLPVATMK